VDLDGRVQRHFASIGTEQAETSLLGGVIWHSKPKDHRLTGGQASPVSVREYNHSVDQLAVTPGFSA
jgi:hypothetical protein